MAVSWTGCAAEHVAKHEAAHVHLSRADLDAIAATARHVVTLKAELASLVDEVKALKARLGFVEPRVGLRELEKTPLRDMPGGAAPVNLIDARVIQEPGGKAKRTSLAKHLARYDGLVVAFWATWCVPCIADDELANIRLLRKQLRRRNVDLVSMAIDDLDAVLAHPKAARWLYPLWHREGGHLEMVPRRFVEAVGVNLPLFLVVNRSGEITHFYNAKLEPDVMRDMVTTVAY